MVKDPVISSEWSHRKVFWLFHFSYWIAIGLVMLILINTFHPMEEAWMIVASRVGVGFLLTWGLSAIYRTPWMQRMQGLRKWAVAVALTTGACLLGTFFWMEVLHFVRFPEFMESSQFRSMTVARLVAFFFWNGIYFGIQWMQEIHALRLKAEAAMVLARESELKQLQAQLNPHFLFNALNTLMATEQNPEALAMTQHLAEYLRFSLEHANSLEPLGRELGSLEDYLAVQKGRFGSDLECSIECDVSAREILVPPMMIQPLLENAFKYGPVTSAMPLQVEVGAGVIRDGEESHLLVCVANTGRWVNDPPESAQKRHGDEHRTGTGLANLRKRLALLLGERATLEVRKEPAWVRVEIRIPLPAGSLLPAPPKPGAPATS